MGESVRSPRDARVTGARFGTRARASAGQASKGLYLSQNGVAADCSGCCFSLNKTKRTGHAFGEDRLITARALAAQRCRQIVERAHQRSIKVIGATLPPVKKADWDANKEAERQKIVAELKVRKLS